MTPNERECLEGLVAIGIWVAPIDIGGRNGSHHSSTLRRLAIKGLVYRRFRGHPEPQTPEQIKRAGPPRGGIRGSCVYTFTDAGIEALAQEQSK